MAGHIPRKSGQQLRSQDRLIFVSTDFKNEVVCGEVLMVLQKDRDRVGSIAGSTAIRKHQAGRQS